VRDRTPGQSVLDALRQHVLDSWLPIATHPQAAAFHEPVESTPELRAYAERMWTRHVGVERDDLACSALARFVLDIPTLAGSRPDRRPPSRRSSICSRTAGNVVTLPGRGQ
jgi:hypothetical protein